jgi:hypothetical protein
MEEFDLDRHLRASKRVDLSGVDWDQVDRHPLSEAEARCLAYMMDIESHTSICLRDLLATPAAFDPDVTAFLSCWVYEELWHGEAFSRFLGEAGWRLAPDLERVEADSPYTSRVPRNQWIRRRLGGRGQLGHIGTLLGSALMDDFVALHMAWGAANELSTLTSYHRLIARTRHPELINLLNAIIKVNGGTSRSIGRRPGYAWHGAWPPVGSPGGRWSTCGRSSGRGCARRPRRTSWSSSCSATARAREAAFEMDRTIGELPGLGGCEIFRRARTQACDRADRIPVRAPGMWAAVPA